MVSQISSMGLLGIDGFLVRCEVDVVKAMPSFDIVGLPDTAVRESRDRIRSVLAGLGFALPVGKITVNLSPADVKKEGALYDVAILLGLLSSSSQLSVGEELLKGSVFLGELSLSGEIRRVNGILPMVLRAKELGYGRIFVPFDNREEAGVVEGIEVYAPQSMEQLLSHLSGEMPLDPFHGGDWEAEDVFALPDFADVKGQAGAKRALEIAAAGGHNIMLIGPPGSGKSMLAKRLPSILPPMTFEEAMEVTKIHSVAGVLPPGVSLLRERPFRSPHHTISSRGLTGGGSTPRPGELSLAHNGVLFLDELPEFQRDAIEVLRQPMENGVVTISRVRSTLSFPCRVMVAAAMNPCPCGYFGHPTRECTCTETKVKSYLSKISGPVLDRMDLHVEVMPVEFAQLSSSEPAESSCEIRKRVVAAREMQRERLKEAGVYYNAAIPPGALNRLCPMTQDALALLKVSFDRLGLSARAYDRVLKVARTIADLAGEETIGRSHIAEAVQYRSLDRKYWGT